MNLPVENDPSRAPSLEFCPPGPQVDETSPPVARASNVISHPASNLGAQDYNME